MNHLEPGDIVANSYRIIRQIGIGGAGVVWEAQEVQTQHPCALKVLHRHLRRNEKVATRFIREARAARALTTPHAVKIESTGMTQDGTPFIVMEFLHGRPLSEIIAERGGRMTVEQVLYLVDQVATALADAHSHGIIHRDLKPDNIFIVPLRSGPFIKIVDFGISKIFSGQDMKKVTETGATVGTPQYMPLEQLKGLQDLDGRVDVYALGVIMFELFAGHRPIDAFSYQQVVLNVASQAAPSLATARSDLPAGLIQVVDSCLARERANRIPTMKKLKDALAPFWSGESPSFMPGAPELSSAPSGPGAVVPEVPVPRVSAVPQSLSETRRSSGMVVSVGNGLDTTPSSGVSRDGGNGQVALSVPKTEDDFSLDQSNKGISRRTAFVVGVVAGAVAMLVLVCIVLGVLFATSVISV